MAAIGLACPSAARGERGGCVWIQKLQVKVQTIENLGRRWRMSNLFPCTCFQRQILVLGLDAQPYNPHRIARAHYGYVRATRASRGHKLVSALTSIICRIGGSIKADSSRPHQLSRAG